jgi:hypothetical protein
MRAKQTKATIVFSHASAAATMLSNGTSRKMSIRLSPGSETNHESARIKFENGHTKD